jgi:hypothetical protein
MSGDALVDLERSDSGAFLWFFHHVRISHFRDEVHVTIFCGSISLDELGVSNSPTTSPKMDHPSTTDHFITPVTVM